MKNNPIKFNPVAHAAQARTVNDMAFEKPTAYTRLTHYLKTQEVTTATNKELAEAIGYTARSLAYALSKARTENQISETYHRGASGELIRTITWVETDGQ